MNRELIRKARQANLSNYLIWRGEPLVRQGRRYQHKDHDSLVFTENAYYWNSRSEHGNAIDFLMSFYGLDFKTAVAELAGFNVEDAAPTGIELAFEWNKLALNRDMRRVCAYLHSSRGIGNALISELIKNKLLFQEQETNNILFPIYDESGGAIVGVETSGTLTHMRFKGVKTGSKYGYGYNLKKGDETAFMLFFESAIDLISFVDLAGRKQKTLSGCWLVSLAGLKPNIFELMISKAPSAKAILCVDNDEPGQAFVSKIMSQHPEVKTHLPPGEYKDWNQQLLALKNLGD